jgi:hypothetical protein
MPDEVGVIGRYNYLSPFFITGVKKNRKNTKNIKYKGSFKIIPRNPKSPISPQNQFSFILKASFFLN